jgi:hypothetical protein
VKRELAQTLEKNLADCYCPRPCPLNALLLRLPLPAQSPHALLPSADQLSSAPDRVSSRRLFPNVSLRKRVFSNECVCFFLLYLLRKHSVKIPQRNVLNNDGISSEASACPGIFKKASGFRAPRFHHYLCKASSRCSRCQTIFST